MENDIDMKSQDCKKFAVRMESQRSTNDIEMLSQESENDIDMVSPDSDMVSEDSDRGMARIEHREEGEKLPV